MAVYWVDLYIDAPVGGIHGTVDGTTRDGTYSYPFRATDVVTSAQNITTINGVLLVSGDEVRLKGMPSYGDFLDDMGATYTTNYYTLRTTTYNAGITSKVASGVTAVFAFVDSADMIPLLSDPIVMFTGTHTPSPSVYHTVAAYSGTGATGFLSAMYKSSGSASKLNLYLVDPQYYIANTYLNTGTSYFCHFGTDIIVTDGWVSETERGGKNVVVFNHSVTTSRIIYLNGTTNGVGWTLFDCPNTYFCNNNTTTNSLQVGYYLHGANAPASIYKGNGFTQKIGGFVSGGSTQSYNYVGFYYSTAAGVDISCNNSEVNISISYYPFYMRDRYGSNNYHTIRNMLVFQSSTFLNLASTYPRTFNVGSVLEYSGSTYFMVSNSGTGLSAYTINLMDNAVYYCYSAGTALFNDVFTPQNCTFVIGSGVENWTSSKLSSEKLTSSTSGPIAIAGVASFPTAYQYSLKMNSASWADSIVLKFTVGTASSTVAYANSFATSLHHLDCEGQDYKTSNHSILFNHAQYFYTGTTTLVSDANLHFSLNSYDKKPIGFASATSTNGTTYYGMMYYNDSSKGNALCFQSNGNQSLNTQYTKLIEVTVPTYTTDDIKIEIDLETSSDWNTNTGAYVYYKNDSNVVAAATLKSVTATAITTKTTYSVTIPNVALSPLGVKHMQVQLRIYNGSTPSKKFYVHDVRAVLA